VTNKCVAAQLTEKKKRRTMHRFTHRTNSGALPLNARHPRHSMALRVDWWDLYRVVPVPFYRGLCSSHALDLIQTILLELRIQLCCRNSTRHCGLLQKTID
jgi:hypothetical protein